MFIVQFDILFYKFLLVGHQLWSCPVYYLSNSVDKIIYFSTSTVYCLVFILLYRTVKFLLPYGSLLRTLRCFCEIQSTLETPTSPLNKSIVWFSVWPTSYSSTFLTLGGSRVRFSKGLNSKFSCLQNFLNCYDSPCFRQNKLNFLLQD